MATVNLIQKYRCSNDCRAEGCPTHNAVLNFQTVSNAYSFNNGKGHTYYFEENELEALIILLKKLSKIRGDALTI